MKKIALALVLAFGVVGCGGGSPTSAGGGTKTTGGGAAPTGAGGAQPTDKK